jgi:hypothetical protein
MAFISGLHYGYDEKKKKKKKKNQIGSDGLLTK